ncbi:hypothetical protein MY4824_009646 [Beauveria thailandica]
MITEHPRHTLAVICAQEREKVGAASVSQHSWFRDFKSTKTPVVTPSSPKYSRMMTEHPPLPLSMPRREKKSSQPGVETQLLVGLGLWRSVTTQRNAFVSPFTIQYRKRSERIALPMLSVMVGVCE